MASNSNPKLLARYRQLAPTASVRVSPLCLGAMTFGDKQQERYGKITKDEAFAVMDAFYQAGGNFIDTANGYQLGQSEEWVGEWMKARDVRDQIVLATKYTTGYMGAHKDAIQANYGGNNVKSMRNSVIASLKKLQTDYIDLLYVHWWDYTTTIPELMLALDDLVKAGKVLMLGISDAPAWVVAKANQYARDHGLRQFSVYQGMWNASMRDFERDIIPMCRDEGMGLCPYGVLNQGRFQTAEGFKQRDQHNEGRNFIPTSQRDRDVSAHLEKIANDKGVTLLNVALAYVMQKTPYVFPIVGARKVEHILGSIEGVGVTLSDEDMKNVEEAYPFDHGFPHTFLSGTLFNPEAKPQTADTADDVFLTKTLGKFDFVQPTTAIKGEDMRD